jgi:LCP family protein required for cell wall assembly
VVALIELLVSKMLPTTYLLLFVVIIWILLFLAFTLMVLVRKRKGQTKKQFYCKRGLGTGLSVFTIVVCLLITHYIGILNTTISNITQEKVVITNTIAVYVPIGSPAEEIGDAADETFGYATGFDYENSLKAVDAISEEVGQEIATAEYDTVFDTVDALYRGEIGAMILNYSYEEIVSDMEGYEDFTSLTKIIYEYDIETVVEKPVESEETVKSVTDDVFVVYLSGSDTRSAKLSTSRSDVNILAFVNPTSKQVLLLNTPRDYYVPISISSNGTRDKLTHCGIYGVDCSMDTLGALYDTSVDYYMQVNFEGFKTLVDAIGGIEVVSDKTFVTTHYDVQIYEGTNYLDGTGALGFVRERYAFSDGDNARGRNTMRVVAAIINKLSSGTTILSNYSAIMSSMEGMFVTDMSSDEIASLVKMQLSDMSSWDIRQFAVTGTGDSQTTYSVPNQRAYVMVPDESSVAKAKELIEKMESGEVLTDADFE